MKYEIKYEIKKFEELYPNGNPVTVTQYVDDNGNTVDKEDTVKEFFIMTATAGEDTFKYVISFGTHGFTESSLDKFTAREFIQEFLIPNTKAINAMIDNKLKDMTWSELLKKGPNISFTPERYKWIQEAFDFGYKYNVIIRLKEYTNRCGEILLIEMTHRNDPKNTVKYKKEGGTYIGKHDRISNYLEHLYDKLPYVRRMKHNDDSRED